MSSCPPYVILASLWIWNVIQYLSRSPFFIQFPNRALVVIYTDCGAVNFITRSKNSLSYQIELFDSLTVICWTHLQIFKVQWSEREIFFWQKIFSAVILSGLGSRAQQSLIGLTMLVIADSEDIVRILSGGHSVKSPVCSVSGFDHLITGM